MTNDTDAREGDDAGVDRSVDVIERDELAHYVAEECDRLAEKWWYDRDCKQWALEHDLWWEEPNTWLGQTRPPVRACGAVLAHILTRYEPGEMVEVEEILEWARTRSKNHHDRGARHLHHGFARAGKAIREGTGYGWPDPDPILGGGST